MPKAAEQYAPLSLEAGHGLCLGIEPGGALLMAGLLLSLQGLRICRARIQSVLDRRVEGREIVLHRGPDCVSIDAFV